MYHFQYASRRHDSQSRWYSVCIHHRLCNERVKASCASTSQFNEVDTSLPCVKGLLLPKYGQFARTSANNAYRHLLYCIAYPNDLNNIVQGLPHRGAECNCDRLCLLPLNNLFRASLCLPDVR